MECKYAADGDDILLDDRDDRGDTLEDMTEDHDDRDDMIVDRSPFRRILVDKTTGCHPVSPDLPRRGSQDEESDMPGGSLHGQCWFQG